jgi:RNA polymerase sigma factor (sigma-70 family)
VAFAILAATPASLSAMSNHLLTPSGIDADERADAAFREHYALLFFIAASRFRLPEPDAENVVQDVFLQFLRHRHRITDDRAWLIAAACNASRDYWRSPQRGEGAALPERSIEPANTLAAQLDVKMLMRSLPDKCRDLLRHRYSDGSSIQELAARYTTTCGYVKVMVHRCLKAARALLVGSRRTS